MCLSLIRSAHKPCLKIHTQFCFPVSALNSTHYLEITTPQTTPLQSVEKIKQNNFFVGNSTNYCSTYIHFKDRHLLNLNHDSATNPTKTKKSLSKDNLFAGPLPTLKDGCQPHLTFHFSPIDSISILKYNESNRLPYGCQ